MCYLFSLCTTIFLWSSHHHICFANNDPIEENDLGILSKQCMYKFCPAVDNLEMWLKIEYYCHGSYNDPMQILYRGYTSSESSNPSIILKSNNRDIHTSHTAKQTSVNEYLLNKFLLALFYGFVSIAGIHCGLWYGRRLKELRKESNGYKMISSSSPHSYSVNNHILADAVLIDRVETKVDKKIKEYKHQIVPKNSRIVYGSSNVDDSTRDSNENDINYNSDDTFGVTIGRSYSSFFNSSHYSDDDDDDDDNNQLNQENASLLNRRKQQFNK